MTSEIFGIEFESLLAECESFAKTLEFGYSSLTQRYEPKGLGGFQ